MIEHMDVMVREFVDGSVQIVAVREYIVSGPRLLLRWALLQYSVVA